MHSLYFITKQENNQWVYHNNKFWKKLLKIMSQNDTIKMFYSKGNPTLIFMAFQPQIHLKNLIIWGWSEKST